MPHLAVPIESSITKCDVRESYRRFPAWSQPLWTLLTAKPLPGEVPMIRLSPIAMATMTLMFLFTLITVHLALLNAEGTLHLIGLWLTPVFALLVCGALRKIQVVYVHHAVHQTFIPRNAAANRLTSNLFTTLALIQNPDEYRTEHFEHHSRSIFTTRHDADAALLYKFGLRPGRSIKALKAALLKTLISPAFHLYFLTSRLRSNLIARPLPWRLASATWLLVIAVAAPLTLGIVNTALAIWLPLVFIYQMSALVQFLTEHLWLLTEQAPSELDAYADRCVGRFCGEMLPAPGNVIAWIGWWARTLFIHIPVRFGILVGDLPAHDWHHLCGFVRQHPAQWPQAIYARQQAIDSGLSMGMEKRELWGLSRMLQHVFDAMSKAPEMAEQARPLLRDKSDASAHLT